MSTKPILIFVPGAWHESNVYDQVMTKLESFDYHTIGLTLPSVGAEPPLLSIDDDVSLIRSTVSQAADDGNDVVLVMHSYGGIPGCEALRDLAKSIRSTQRKLGGVIGLVFLCAYLIPVGESVASLRPRRDSASASNPLEVKNNSIRVLTPIPMFYNDLPTEEAERWAGTLKSHSVRTFASPLTYAAYKDIPTTYLVCERDGAISLERQLDFIKRTGVEMTVRKCNAGHSPFLSQPDTVVDVVREAAGEKLVHN